MIEAAAVNAPVLHCVVVTLFPDMLAAVTAWGVSGRAVKQGLLQVSAVNPRDFSGNKHRSVDDRPFGGGPGMVMQAPPLLAAIDEAKRQVGGAAKVVYLSPQGKPLTQERVQALSESGPLVLLAGRYEGIDERVITQAVDEEVSIGDYVLSGGELPAMVLIDAMARLLPGALGDAMSAEQDSFADGLLDCPHYTRPEVLNDLGVPDVLMSGNHAEIRRWRLKQALARTQERRPDLLVGRPLSREEQQLLDEILREQASGNAG